MRRAALAALVLCCASGLLAVQQAAAAEAAGGACLLKLKVQGKDSTWTGGGRLQAPTQGKIVSPKLSPAGVVFLRVPAKECPPKLTAANADDILQQASLEVPNGASSLTFTPSDLQNKILTGDDGTVQLGRLNFLGLGLGLTGNEPLGPKSVTVGSGTVAEAKAAAQQVCAQLLMLNGTLDMSNDIVGKRTADVQHVAFNRTVDAGVSVKKTGDKVSTVTLFLKNVTLALNISPDTTPGVEFSRAQYSLGGDLVATADASDKANWRSVPLEEVAWGAVPRKDSPVVLGGHKTPKPRLIGVNSTLPQECKPSRVLDSSGGAAPAGDGGAKKSAAGAAAASGAAAAAAGVLAAVLAVL